ncbi:MAG: glycosyltransferase family 39 protein [Anaerolineae bacterium]|nr:glycosyltransferase family 39 protein [Anaerolineae bacterium]MDW8172410.1 glycosyltransferase family 39 protein [Anaerolineae bacterium]
MPRRAFVLLLILGLALLLRLPSLGQRSLWYDEAFAVLFARQGLDAMLYGTLTPVLGGAADIHPLLYYLSLNAWMSVFGQGVFVVRLWSVILGLASIAALYALLHDLLDERAALFGALATALVGFHVHYSQEARMYSLLATLLILTTWCALRAWRANDRARWAWWSGFGGCAALAMYTQQLAAFYLVVLGLIVLSLALRYRRCDALIGLVLGAGSALLLYTPWIIHLPAQLDKVRSYYWVTQPTPADFFQTLYLFLTVYAELSAEGLLLGLMGSTALLTLALLTWLMALRKPTSRRQARSAGLLVALWLGPMALMWFVSQLQPVFLERSLIASAAMLYGFVGWSISHARTPRPLRVLMALLFLGLSVLGLNAQYSLDTFPYSPVHRLIEDVREDWRPGDRLIHVNKLSALPGRYYGPDLDQHYLADSLGAAEDTLALPTQEALSFLADPDMPTAAGNAPRLWIVIYARAEREYAATGRPEWAQALAWLKQAGYERTETQVFNDLLLYRYEREGQA